MRVKRLVPCSCGRGGAEGGGEEGGRGGHRHGRGLRGYELAPVTGDVIVHAHLRRWRIDGNGSKVSEGTRATLQHLLRRPSQEPHGGSCRNEGRAPRLQRLQQRRLAVEAPADDQRDAFGNPHPCRLRAPPPSRRVAPSQARRAAAQGAWRRRSCDCAAVGEVDRDGERRRRLEAHHVCRGGRSLHAPQPRGQRGGAASKHAASRHAASEYAMQQARGTVSVR